MDMSWNNNKELSLVISCIKNPLWNEDLENFDNKCLIRELLQKCSGGKIINMLKKILSNEEKTALVKAELDSFFQNQAQSFENHMNIKSDVKTEPIEIKTEPMEQIKKGESEILEFRSFKKDSPLKLNTEGKVFRKLRKIRKKSFVIKKS